MTQGAGFHTLAGVADVVEWLERSCWATPSRLWVSRGGKESWKITFIQTSCLPASLVGAFSLH